MGSRFGERPYRLALAYANTYFVGMSSLGFQRTFEVVHQREGWGAERFFSDGGGMPRSVEKDTPLSNFAALAFSVSFEGDYVHLLQMLRRAGIGLRREERHDSEPLVIMGGSCASINPLPMAKFVDIFVLGAAENTLPALLKILEEEGDKREILERLAETPGFFVPEFHRPEEGLAKKLKKRELSADQMKSPGILPTTTIVTPNTEFSNKFLIEMSRGCPEKCHYCWATFGMGKFRFHPTEYILEAFERARPVTDQLGFVATAVGDHPDIELLLRRALDLGFRSSVSSIRIPAVTEGVLEVLHASGDRSITLAPETGSDRLRAGMGKYITNDQLLHKVRLIFAAGLTNLKLYFIVGLPGEMDEDIEAILELSRRILPGCRRDNRFSRRSRLRRNRLIERCKSHPSDTRQKGRRRSARIPRLSELANRFPITRVAIRSQVSIPPLPISSRNVLLCLAIAFPTLSMFPKALDPID